MIIEFRCEIEQARQWMRRETLTVGGRDVPVQIAWTTTTEPRPAGLDALFHGTAARVYRLDLPSLPSDSPAKDH